MHRLALLEKGEDKSVELATAAAEEAWRQDIERSMRSDEGSGDSRPGSGRAATSSGVSGEDAEERLEREKWFDSLFELADTWTKSVNPQECMPHAAKPSCGASSALSSRKKSSPLDTGGKNLATGATAPRPARKTRRLYHSAARQLIRSSSTR